MYTQYFYNISFIYFVYNRCSYLSIVVIVFLTLIYLQLSLFTLYEIEDIQIFGMKMPFISLSEAKNHLSRITR